MKEQRLKTQITAATEKDKQKSKLLFANEELISEDFFLTADPNMMTQNLAAENDQFDPEAFVHKNQHIMPYYREYEVEKRRINQLNQK